MKKTRWLQIGLIAALLSFGAGCAQPLTPTPAFATAIPARLTADSTHTAIDTLPTNTGEPNLMNQTPTAPEKSGLEMLIAQAKRDLAARLSIQESDIELVKAEAVVWSDASLGCPQPEMAYIQIPFDGSLIILQAGGRQYEFHAGGKRGVFLCEQPPDKLVKPPPIDLQQLTPPAPDNSIPPGENQ